ncbi:tetratricopeptide repeat protein [Magnetovibrio sp. PR-2]|uniref:tetratricopeptide repeat protein n=1 Tax=Magnetovibrio sp. PR-2 TaxID=3120356 RepID=UPI002FCE0622
MGSVDADQERVQEIYQRFEQSRFDEAIALGVAFLEHHGEHPDVLLVMGLISIQRGDAANSIVLLEAAYALAPDNPNIVYNLGVAFQKSDQMDRAKTFWEEALTLYPEHVAALKNLTVSSLENGDFPSVREFATRILKLSANDREALNWLAYAYYQEDNFELAEALYRKIMKLYPDEPEAHYRHGLVARDLALVDASLKSFERAVQLCPDDANAHMGLAHALLMKGQYRDGFAQYEWRRKREAWPEDTVDAPYWAGEEILGKSVLVKAEQGHGDVIQFLRYLPKVAKRVGRLSVSVHPALMSLVEKIDGVDGVETIHLETGQYDAQVPMMSLAHIFETSLDTIPDAVFPDIDVNPELSKIIPSNSEMNVGVVWAGNPERNNDHFRSCPFASFKHLFAAVPQATFFSLQVGDVADDLRASQPENVIDLSPQLKSYEDTAGFIKGMDLVISVDTSTLHLAASMGVETWNMLGYAADWRWFEARDDNPWYPTMRLFRQEKLGDWDGLVQRLSKALSARISAH